MNSEWHPILISSYLDKLAPALKQVLIYHTLQSLFVVGGKIWKFTNHTL